MFKIILRMKRLSLTLAMLFVLAIGTWADHWTPVHGEEGQSTSTIVYAELNLGSANTINEENYENYEIAAFIDDEVRAVAKATKVGQTSVKYCFVLNIPGNYDSAGEEDNGKSITFKMFNSSTEIEYDLGGGVTISPSRKKQSMVNRRTR